MEADKVVFAEDSVTVHKVLGKPITKGREKTYMVESVTLVPGDTINFDELPHYVQNPLLNDGIDGLRLLTQEEVDMRLAERNRILGLTATQSVEM